MLHPDPPAREFALGAENDASMAHSVDMATRANPLVPASHYWLPIEQRPGGLRLQLAREASAPLRRLIETALVEDDLSGFEELFNARGSRVVVARREGEVAIAIKRYAYVRAAHLRTFARTCRARREAGALALVSAKVANPVRPLAWGCVRRWGCTARGYVVTTFFEDAFDLRRLRRLPEEERPPLIEGLLEELPGVVARLHEAGVFVKTLRGKNLLYRPRDRQVALIDLPRAKALGSVGVKQRLFDLGMLFGELRYTFSRAQLQRFLEAYLQASPSLSPSERAGVTVDATHEVAERIGHRTWLSSRVKRVKKWARRTRVGQASTGRRFD